MIKGLTRIWRTVSDYLVGSRHSGDGNVFESRLRRILIWVPLAGTVLLLAWAHLVREPGMRSLVGQNKDLIVLETAIKDYRLRLSDQEFTDLQVRRRDAELFILQDEAATGRLLAQILDQASNAGWTSQAVPDTAASEPIAALPELTRVSQPLVLEYTGTAPADAYAGMLKWLEQLSRLDKRVDILAINFEQGDSGPLRLRLRLGFIQRSKS